MFPYIILGDNITLVIKDRQFTIAKSHVNYAEIKSAIREGKWDLVENLIDTQKRILDFSQGNITISGTTLFYKGMELKNVLTEKIFQMLTEGFDITPFINFMENLMQNPSNTAIEELYKFLESGNMPITPDGCFLAFKKIKANYMDVHSGKVLNKPSVLLTVNERNAMPMQTGKKNEVTVSLENGITTISMPRNMVDDQRTNTCSHGLHFCSLNYLRSFSGERIVVLKINPADVVSIPSDYNNTKGRTWKYQVIEELNQEPENAFTKSVQVTTNNQKTTPLRDSKGRFLKKSK